jgi:STE24 endopeptidase
MSNFSLWMTLAFACLLVANLVTKFWLANRQVRHVAAHRTQVPTDFAASIDLSAHQKAAAYTIAKLRLGLIDLALDTVLLLGWTLLGGLQWLNELTLAWLGQGMSQQMALVVSFMLIGGLIGLPLSLYQTFGLEQRFGFNNATWRLWLSDLVKGLIVGAILGLPILWLVLWLMQAGGTLWWLWTWAALVVYQLFVMWIAPNVIMPLFNKFTPLEDDSLKERATRLMNECGFQSKGFFVMDGSRRSSHSNAFFTGFGSAKRVVFFDTLLKQLNGDEMQAVLAHELGHFKHRHILKMMLTSFASSLLGLALLGWLSQQVWFYTGLGVLPNLEGSNNALALLLFMLALPLLTFFITPLSSRRSRRFEFEADAYAMQHADAAALRQSLLKLYQDNASTLTPDPWYVAFYYSHPPASQRLARMQA